MLKAGLMLSLLSGYAAMSRGEAVQPVVPSSSEYAITHHDYGPFVYYEDAHDVREEWREKGHVANIFEDGRGYWVRVIDK